MHTRPLLLAIVFASQVTADLSLSWLLSSKRSFVRDEADVESRQSQGRSFGPLEGSQRRPIGPIKLPFQHNDAYKDPKLPYSINLKDLHRRAQGPASPTISISTSFITVTLPGSSCTSGTASGAGPSRNTGFGTGTAYSSASLASSVVSYPNTSKSYPVGTGTPYSRTGTAYSTGLPLSSTSHGQFTNSTVTSRPSTGTGVSPVSASPVSSSFSGTNHTRTLTQTAPPYANSTTSAPSGVIGTGSLYTRSSQVSRMTGVSTGTGSGFASLTKSAPFYNSTTTILRSFVGTGTGTGISHTKSTITPSFPASGSSAGYPSISVTKAPIYSNTTSALPTSFIPSGYSLSGSGSLVSSGTGTGGRYPNVTTSGIHTGVSSGSHLPGSSTGSYYNTTTFASRKTSSTASSSASSTNTTHIVSSTSKSVSSTLSPSISFIKTTTASSGTAFSSGHPSASPVISPSFTNTTSSATKSPTHSSSTSSSASLSLATTSSRSSLYTTSTTITTTTTTTTRPVSSTTSHSPSATASPLCGVHGPPLGIGFMADFAEQGAEPITELQCSLDCQAQSECASYTYYYIYEINAPRCDLYYTNVSESVRIDENYDTTQIWYDRECPAPQKFSPPVGLPPFRKEKLWERMVGWIKKRAEM